ncbi:Nif3-like dinuclear metal center hexameric protein [Candidatus Woesearchaeota archaeon]|jgi:dinuclear metal center YbgI/SA1388 family protein|nr:Nif3-like dinuclear metal center hexameric protein [Candidatus Woesearchaeota archaeon]MBT6518712.1 Nif3-like dinuclear metal center hexameric protein [Candidatus Woesearchaeota archaeon]MBT7368366.1 Nif3-like dinuclear metal center hexameric protein [Candidatus Woesearchaeota archaeon]
MANLKKIEEFLNKTLEIDKFSSDVSHNGLQVQGNDEIKNICFCVDASMDFFKKAKKENCDLLIVHHGMFWNKKETITGHIYKKVKFLIDNNMSLYACHLPLDAHLKYGNNSNILRILGAKIKEKIDVGYVGELNKSIDLKKLVEKINDKLDTRCKLICYGKKKIKNIAVISGGAPWNVFDTFEKNIDVYITGDIAHGVYHPTKESKMNFISAGHYATETVGVKALMPLLEKKFKVKTVFIDVPTGL